MIWLSALAGTRECSVYFDIRDIDVHRTGSATEGIVRGIVGDGCHEFWGEVSIGTVQQVNILPIWEEGDALRHFATEIDFHLLEKQLAEAVAKVFSGIAGLTAAARLPYGGFLPAARSQPLVAAG